MGDRVYIAIDLKSFYASVACIERGLDPLTTNLVVADLSRTEKTICLAVTPALKAYGISGRARLFEVVERVKEINAQRLKRAPGHIFTGRSCFAPELEAHPELELDYIVAQPQMARYMDWSARIYQIYLKYVAPEDIHVYSIDEVFMDVTQYLITTGLTAKAFAKEIIQDVAATTGITAAAGIGTNLYLCKIAMDIGGKHTKPDPDGIRIAQLDEMQYRKLLWDHRPLTDFWRIGVGIAKKLEAHGMYTMGDIARCSIGTATDFYNEELLYKLFGINAELLIDHAWGWEPCTIADIKAYKPKNNSICAGQVLQTPYPTDKARLVVREMADSMAMDLVAKGLQTDQLTLTLGYDIENLRDPERRKQYKGQIKTDRYGRKVPKHAHGTANLAGYTASTKAIIHAVVALFDRIVDPSLLIRRFTLSANRVLAEPPVPDREQVQLDLFDDAPQQGTQEFASDTDREKKIQTVMLDIQKKYGKNAILKGMNLEEGATAVDRNSRIGGHKA